MSKSKKRLANCVPSRAAQNVQNHSVPTTESMRVANRSTRPMEQPKRTAPLSTKVNNGRTMPPYQGESMPAHRIRQPQANRANGQPPQLNRTAKRYPSAKGIPTQQNPRTKEPPRSERSTNVKRNPQTGANRAKRQAAPPRRLTHGELRRRRRRRNLLLALLTLVVIGVGVALSFTVLFKVKNFRVENLDKSTPANTGIYTEDAILAALGVPVGENMFQFSAKEKQQAVEVALPYLETVEIRRSLPSTVVVRVEPATETWCMQTDSGWLTLSNALKIMKISDEKPENLPVLSGLSIETPVAGYQLKMTEAQTQDDLTNLISTLEKYDIKGDCTEIALGDANNAYVIYQNRAKIMIGTFNNLDYKIQFASVIMKDEDGKGVGENEKGTLDVSHQLEDGSIRPTWSPGDYEVTSTTDESQQNDNSAAQSEPQATDQPQGDTENGDAAATQDNGGEANGDTTNDAAANTDGTTQNDAQQNAESAA